VIGDEKWLKETFIQTVQQRGAAIIKARGLSSAASAANAVVDTVRSLITDTPKGGLAQRRIVFHWRIWSRKWIDLLVSGAGKKWKGTSSTECPN
jgi:Malate/lactate dehydrogenases